MFVDVLFPKNHRTLQEKRGLTLYDAGFWDVQTTSDSQGRVCFLFPVNLLVGNCWSLQSCWNWNHVHIHGLIGDRFFSLLKNIKIIDMVL